MISPGDWPGWIALCLSAGSIFYQICYQRSSENRERKLETNIEIRELISKLDIIHELASQYWCSEDDMPELKQRLVYKIKCFEISINAINKNRPSIFDFDCNQEVIALRRAVTLDQRGRENSRAESNRIYEISRTIITLRRKLENSML